jgi:tRNA (adenine57-N1/adenine58-N1)-methyltransferase catalytic subunit
MIKRLLVRKAKKVQVDDRIVIVADDKMYFVENLDKDFHCSDGVFSKDDLKNSNMIIKSNTNKEFFIIDADFIDSFKGIKKLAQTIPLKDLGFILAETGLNKNSVVVDAGAGSGASACFLARHVKRVYSYDINQSNLNQAKNNAEYFEIKNIIFKIADVYTKIPNKNVDLILLDLPEPWNAVDSAFRALKPGGFLIVYCPQITQSQELVNTASQSNFLHLKTVEIVERDWKIEGQIVRPRSLSTIHSGFITVMRKIL